MSKKPTKKLRKSPTGLLSLVKTRLLMSHLMKPDVTTHSTVRLVKTKHQARREKFPPPFASLKYNNTMKIWTKSKCTFCSSPLSVIEGADYVEIKCNKCKKAPIGDYAINFSCLVPDVAKKAAGDDFITGQWLWGERKKFKESTCTVSNDKIKVVGNDSITQNPQNIVNIVWDETTPLSQVAGPMLRGLGFGAVFFLVINYNNNQISANGKYIIGSILVGVVCAIVFGIYAGLFKLKNITAIKLNNKILFRVYTGDAHTVVKVLNRFNYFGKNDSEETRQRSLKTFTQNNLPIEMYNLISPKLPPSDENELIDSILNYEKYIKEEWSESVPLYAAIKLDKQGYVFTIDIVNALDNYAKHFNRSDFSDLISAVMASKSV